MKTKTVRIGRKKRTGKKIPYFFPSYHSYTIDLFLKTFANQFIVLPVCDVYCTESTSLLLQTITTEFLEGRAFILCFILY